MKNSVLLLKTGLKVSSSQVVEGHLDNHAIAFLKISLGDRLYLPRGNKLIFDLEKT